jgi:hypothetical protein
MKRLIVAKLDMPNQATPVPGMPKLQGNRLLSLTRFTDIRKNSDANGRIRV